MRVIFYDQDILFDDLIDFLILIKNQRTPLIKTDNVSNLNFSRVKEVLNPSGPVSLCHPNLFGFVNLLLHKNIQLFKEN